MSLFLLWTDIFVYFLIILSLGSLYYIQTEFRLRQAFKQIFIQPVPTFSCLVLGFFMTIGLMDSIHFKVLESDTNIIHTQKGEIVSVLDLVLNPMRLAVETTFSAPFALTEYTKTTVLKMNKDDGVNKNIIELEYKRLNINKSVDEKNYISHIGILSLKGLALGGFITWLFGVMISFLKKRQVLHSKFPAKTWVFTVGILCIFISLIYYWMPHYHILGTSKVGGDVLYQCLKSIRTGLVIGTLTTLVMLPFAVFLGVMAGYFKGKIDDIISYVYTMLSAIPSVLLIAAAVMSLQVIIDKHPEWFPTMLERADIRLLSLCFILGITSWTGLCRILRGEALKLREIDYVQAAKSLGVGPLGVLTKHLIPNMMHILLISIALDFSGLVLAEAVLSYIGVGVDPTQYSFGTLINSARLEMARSPVVWWSLAGAFGFMFALVLCANLFADALRDALDPRGIKEPL